MADGLSVFYGEFLVLPVPLQISGNWCTHNCSYCFANLNNPTRRLDFKGVMATLANHHKREGLDARLLRYKYPVLISNLIDPFSKSNADPMADIIEFMTALDIPVYFQTKFGDEKAIARVLDYIKPSVFYVSITHQTEKTRKLIEPAAPSMDHRYEMIKEVVSRGHRVVCGVNPLHPDWIPEPEVVMEKLAALGVEGVWIELFHLSGKQRNRMQKWQKANIGEENIKIAMKRYATREQDAHYLRAKKAAEEVGMSTCRVGQPGRSDFFKPYRETYPGKTFPVMQDFQNHCIDNDITMVTWDEWFEFFGDRLPKLGKTNQHIDYIRQGSHLELTKHFDNMTRKTKFGYSSLLHTAFRYQEFRKLPFSPWNKPCFTPVQLDGAVMYKTPEGAISLNPSEGTPIFYFDPTGETTAAEL